MEALVLERISELWRYRAWWRTHRYADWPEVRRDLDLELRALVKLTRQYRRLEAARPDPLDAYKSFASWTEGEKVEAFGR